MHQVKIVGHYGGPMIIDQCDKCGGIWFDEAELFRAKQGEAERIEMLDAGILQTASMIEHLYLICPRDDSTMQQFTDRYFPQDIVLVRCPSCRGIWLNRGMFSKYQQFRQEMVRPKKKSPQDEEVSKRIAELVKSYETGGSTETLRRLGEFLSTPMDSGHDFSCTPDNGAAAGGRNVAMSAITILLTILRLIFRF